MNLNKIVADALQQPKEAIRRYLTTAIREANPNLEVFEVVDYSDLHERFAAHGFCRIAEKIDLFPDVTLRAWKGGIHKSPEIQAWTIDWNDGVLNLMQIKLDASHCREAFTIMWTEKEEDIRSFHLALHEFQRNLSGAILVYEEGRWSHDQDLFNDIKNSTFDSLIMPQGMSDQIRDDVQNWLDSKELYESHGIPWKRGMIFVGPPGNGKTHLVKSLINHFGLNTLYVRGFKAMHRSSSSCISEVFDRARDCNPTMLILEDLDYLVDSKNRSHFLNEMDGFAQNHGILTIASANDPARLDPALVNRPSRFDRRYTFTLPAHLERSRYLSFFTSKLDANLHLSEIEVAQLAAETEGFSYAYLKELVLSSMMAWISGGRDQRYSEVMSEHAKPLLDQMTLELSQPVESEGMPNPYRFPWRDPDGDEDA